MYNLSKITTAVQFSSKKMPSAILPKMALGFILLTIELGQNRRNRRIRLFLVENLPILSLTRVIAGQW